MYSSPPFDAHRPQGWWVGTSPLYHAILQYTVMYANILP